MNVLALDLGTKTGWALLAQGVKESGVQVFDVKRGESPGMRFVRLERWLQELCIVYGKDGPVRAVDTVVFEQAHHRGGAATAVGVGFEAHVLSFCARQSINHQPVHTATLKKFVTGRGNAKKPEMVAAVGERWGRLYKTRPQALDDNEADAIGLLELALAEIVGVTV